MRTPVVLALVMVAAMSQTRTSTLIAASDVAARVGGARLIPRAELFGNPERTQPRISPDGRHISWIAPHEGVLNVFVAPAGDLAAARVVTADRLRGIREHRWAYDNAHILYLQDDGGDENWHVYSVDVIARTPAIDLTPDRGVQAQLVGLSWKRPGTVVVALNNRVREWHDQYAIDVATGKRTLVEENTNEIAGYVFDADLRARLALRMGADGNDVLHRSGTAWTRLLHVGHADTQTTRILNVEEPGTTALFQSSIGRDTAALVRVDLGTGVATMIGGSDRADLESVWTNPRTGAPLAYSVNYLKPELTAVDPAVAKDLAILKRALGDGIDVVSQTLDDTTWIVQSDDAKSPVAYSRYDRRTGTVVGLFTSRPALASAPLVAMHPRVIAARDGLPLVSYLSLPPGSDPNGDGIPDARVPLVLNVHGGPWDRDTFGLSNQHQWLANRGYAVLSVNFRGSTGFGKRFLNAANHEWAAKMHDDLLDGVQWAVAQKIALADKVAIVGASYGGYATLVGLTFTPDTFACGVDIVGPSNLPTLFATIPTYWKAFYEEFAARVGDPRTDTGRKLLVERSPLSRVDRITKPLLIGQGANDPRVKQSESDQIVQAMKAKGLPVTYVLYPDEGHGFARPENRTSFNAIAEAFLGRCLGGRVEPVGKDFEGSTHQIREGAPHVGLAQ
jgi:dipeptidyl aminopeptidase/acylaminoacyl peptidase